MRTATNTLKSLVLDTLLPPGCASCTAPVTDNGALCPSCWSRLRLIERPVCARLGLPLAYDMGPDGLSAQAIATPPAYDRARAVCLYSDIARALVHQLKYRDHLETAKTMARAMWRAGRDLLDGAALIVPVPLHRRRLWYRRSNQAAELAREIARLAHCEFHGTALKRVRATRRQVGLTRPERTLNVRGAFRVPPQIRSAIVDRHIVVVDDVITTGATVEAATRSLRRAGAGGVDVLVFARVGGEANLG